MSFDTWDSGGPGAFWDNDLQWDVNVGPNPGDPSIWLDLVTNAYNQQPNFMAMVDAVLQPFADTLAVTATIPTLYDIDNAVGVQEDIVGQWVGISRNITVPLTGIFFSWGVTGLGWDQGNWITNINATELVVLPDMQYRTLLYATVAANQWDGTIPGAYEVWDAIFAGTGVGILIQDYGNMTMALALTGPVPDAVTLGLFIGGYFSLVPAGVLVVDYFTPAEPDVPYFGWGVENENISGWGVGYWGVKNTGS